MQPKLCWNKHLACEDIMSQYAHLMCEKCLIGLKLGSVIQLISGSG